MLNFKKSIIVFLLTVFAAYEAFAFDGSISAHSAVLIEESTGQVLYAKNQFDKMKPASTTKILTALIALNRCNSDELISVSENAANTEGSSMYIEAGEKISVGNVLYGLMMNSGNDAAVAIAEHISGTTGEFAKLMNKTAREAGAEHSNFVTPNGLDDDLHYTTAHDLALITASAMKIPQFRDIVKTRTKIVETADGTKKYLTNHNKLLGMYEGCEGVKTGFTKASGRTLVSAAARNDMRLIAVTLNAPDDWNDHIRMLDYGFSSYELLTLLNKDFICCKGSVREGVKGYVSISPAKSLTYVVKKSEADLYTVDYKLSEIQAPVSKGDVLGYAAVLKDGKETGRVDLIANESINKIITEKSYGQLLGMFFKSILNSKFF